MAAPFDSNVIREAQEAMGFMANVLESSKHACIRAIVERPGAGGFTGVQVRRA